MTTDKSTTPAALKKRIKQLEKIIEDEKVVAEMYFKAYERTLAELKNTKKSNNIFSAALKELMETHL